MIPKISRPTSLLRASQKVSKNELKHYELFLCLLLDLTQTKQSLFPYTVHFSVQDDEVSIETLEEGANRKLNRKYVIQLF